jgi:hypothetical protein
VCQAHGQMLHREGLHGTVSWREAIRAGFDPGTLGPELSRIGFYLREHISPHEIEARYFQGRTDGFHATEHAHFAWAVVA